MRRNTMWLGDTDCGEGLPDCPKKGPCPGPDCPCVPLKSPGYPARPKSQRKDFCFKCPPKKPCNLNKCPPDTDGTSCGKAKDQEGDLLKLNSDSQAVNVRAVKTSYAVRILDGSVWNGNQQDHCQVPRRFFSNCGGSGEPPKKPSPCSKTTPPSETGPKTSSTKSICSPESECAESSTKPSKASVDCKDTPKNSKSQEITCPEKPKPPTPPSPPTASNCKALTSPKSSVEPKVLYRKCPPPPKLPKLPKCPKPPETKAKKSCAKTDAPKCPPPPTLPKCPESPPQPGKSTKKSCAASTCAKDKSSSGTEVCTSKKVADKKKENTKGIWERLSECRKRKMSTYVGRSSRLLDTTTVSMMMNQTRDLATSYTFLACFSSHSDSPDCPPPLPPWKPSKCKTIEEVCGEQVDQKLKALECKPMDCPRDPNAQCYPEKPRCAEVRKPVEKEKAAGKGSTLKKKSSSDCGKTVIIKTVEKIDYTKIKCKPPKLTELGPCPAAPQSDHKSKDQEHHQIVETKEFLTPLPKPPSAPVVICPCPPPPKLHPGSCPRYVKSEDLQFKSRTEPCLTKAKYACPEIRIYYCPLKKDACNDNNCDEKTKEKKP